MAKLGTVVCTIDSPSTRKFFFTIDKQGRVRKGQLVQLENGDGKLIGRVADIIKTNRYFMNPETVETLDGKPMHSVYPTWEWEYLVAEVDALGVHNGQGFQNSNFPPSPGEVVVEPDLQILEKFFGFDKQGLSLGSLEHHDLGASLNITRLLHKHLGILAMSGSGKTNTTCAIIEELLDKEKAIAVIVIDTHGEYTSFAEDPAYSNKTRVFDISDMRVGMPNLSYRQIALLTEMSSIQLRELAKTINGMKGSYSIPDMMATIESDDGIKNNTKEPLLSCLDELNQTGLFSVADYPPLDELAQAGQLSVIDLSRTISLKKKQIIVSHIAWKLFNARRQGIIPPFLLILEEAHQYAPEKAGKSQAISRGILNTIAREGRKFHASLCLISQRPVHLSTTLLSQCNSNIILRVTNPYDLKHIGETSEGITRNVLDKISSLRVGTALIVGEAVNFPLFVKIRKRKSKESDKGMPLEQAAKLYQEKTKKKSEDAKAFM